MFAKVVRCKAHSEEYKVAVQLYQLTETAQHVTAREILESQITRKNNRC